MTPEQQAAYVNAQAASALIEMYAMCSTNHERMIRNEALAYDEKAFLELQSKYCIGHNAVLGLFIP